MKNKVNKGPKSPKAKGERAKDIRKEQEFRSLCRSIEQAQIISGTKQKKVNKRTSTVGNNLATIFSFIPHKSDSKWIPRSFNEKRQKIEYFKKFCFKHYIPSTLVLDAIREGDIRNPSPRSPRHLAKEFLIRATSGQSFYKQTKEIFTKKEAHYFLSSTNSSNFAELFFEAKIKAREFDPTRIKILISCFTEKLYDNLNVATIEELSRNNVIKVAVEFLDFIARNQDYQWTTNEICDILDFVRGTAGRNPGYNIELDRFIGFSFAGRTVGSVSRVVNEWHEIMARQVVPVRNRGIHSPAEKIPSSWPGYKINNFETQVKDQGTVYNYRITQLLTTDDLYKEGRNMHHCVGSYAYLASKGNCSIFSVTRVECGKRHTKIENVGTVELVYSGGNYRIAQLRAKCNKDVDSLTKTVVERWKREKV